MSFQCTSLSCAVRPLNQGSGFSGTNDIRWLLPLSITQHDLDHQKGTNARVLAYLLRPENGFCVMAHENDEQLTTLQFLRLVATQCPEIRVLLDVGAQILDFSNQQVAKAWLGVVPDAAGAVYFDENDELTVLTRNGISQPISSSPLSQKLDHCIIYLDHAHTRGTDIKFPIGSRAAVTLGPKVTKDALVQGMLRRCDPIPILRFVNTRVYADAQIRPWSLGHVFRTTRSG